MTRVGQYHRYLEPRGQPFEEVAIYRVVVEEERARAQERSSTRTDLEPPGKSPESQKGRTRDLIARRLGKSDRTLEKASDVPIDAGWRAWLYRGAFANLPEELDDRQSQALLGMTELVSDEDFGRSLAESSRPFWQATVRRPCRVPSPGCTGRWRCASRKTLRLLDRIEARRLAQEAVVEVIALDDLGHLLGGGEAVVVDPDHRDET